MDHLRGKAIVASGFHATKRGEIDFFQDALISIGDDGAILSVIRPQDANYANERDRRAAAGNLASVPGGCYLLPGFVDLHIHAPQYRNSAARWMSRSKSGCRHTRSRSKRATRMPPLPGRAIACWLTI
jgi:cytosine/adenosine deaminase-related metal-dependent hydrolase